MNPSGKPVETNSHDAARRLLAEHRPAVPPDLLKRVMDRLPERPEPQVADWFEYYWRTYKYWIALAGVTAAVFLVAVILWRGGRGQQPERISVVFELQAPRARQVELVGSFTNWQKGRVLLHGPDQAGHWSATIELPTGLHEYLFLVDGKEWVADPQAVAYRPDGFGRKNALIEVDSRRNAT
jgi:hypothetical protein